MAQPPGRRGRQSGLDHEAGHQLCRQLDLLGPDYRWRTRWLSPAAIRDGHLTGDLYWQGSGDPAFDRDALADMARTIRARGLGQIDGRRNCWTDRSSARWAAPANSIPTKAAIYQVGPDALLTQFKTVELTLLATPSGWAVRPAGPARPADRQPAAATTADASVRLPPGWSARPCVARRSAGGRLPESCDGSHL